MRMTREEAIEVLENGGWWDLLIPITTIEGRVEEDKLHEALDLALSALRPVSREQVEKVWRGCEYCKKHKINLVRIEMDYNDSPGSPERLNPTRIPKFCPICGAPMTDEAVEMVMERLEALHEADLI